MRGGGTVDDVQLVPVWWGLKWLPNQENGVIVAGGAVGSAIACKDKHISTLRAPGRLERLLQRARTGSGQILFSGLNPFFGGLPRGNNAHVSDRSSIAA